MIGVMFAMGLAGCMGSNTQDMGSPNTIKVIREPKYSNNTPTRRKIQTGKIEVVDYNSSIISPEREGYKAPEPQKQRVTNRVGNRVASRVENKADTAVNGAIDNALGRLFR